MHSKHAFPAAQPFPSTVMVVEAPCGQNRRRLLQEWTDAAAAGGACAWLLPCDEGESGLWAGAATLIEALVPLARQHAPELLDEHANVLSAALPELSQSDRSSTLTDVATGVEAVRNYALDRAYRIPHGLIEFVDAVFQRVGQPRAMVLYCDDFDESGVLARTFFNELMRRRGRALNLSLVLAVEPGHAGQALSGFGGAPSQVVRMALPAAAREVVSRAEMTRRARVLEEAVRRDFDGMEVHIPELIRLWLESDYPDRAHYWQAYALGRYNHRGFYEDALKFVDPVLENLDKAITNDGYFTRWNLVGSIFGCLTAAGQVERAYQVVQDEAVAKITDPTDRARVYYIMAMLHARYLPRRDLAAAERYLTDALALLDCDQVLPEDRHFLTVFLNNGMALIRHRQGRSAEAVALCHDGYEHLSEYVVGDEHRLHRSVLLYNIAQVYTSTREYDRAIQYYSAAMEMDPNYSEYFNERGNVFLKLNRFEEAIRDYRDAIRLSPPYPEVWTNLGQCLRRLGRLDEAEAAYARAIDLDPEVNLAHAGRAHALDLLGRHPEALAEYDAALALDPAQPPLLANRAVLRYDRGEVAEALADLDRAVELAPDLAPLYRNRARALADLGRSDAAAANLERYLELAPSAADRGEVESWLGTLRAELVAA